MSGNCPPTRSAGWSPSWPTWMRCWPRVGSWRSVAGPDDAEDLRRTAPEIVDATRRLLDKVRSGELGNPPRRRIARRRRQRRGRRPGARPRGLAVGRGGSCHDQPGLAGRPARRCGLWRRATARWPAGRCGLWCRATAGWPAGRCGLRRRATAGWPAGRCGLRRHGTAGRPGRSLAGHGSRHVRQAAAPAPQTGRICGRGRGAAGSSSRRADLGPVAQASAAAADRARGRCPDDKFRGVSLVRPGDRAVAGQVPDPAQRQGDQLGPGHRHQLPQHRPRPRHRLPVPRGSGPGRQTIGPVAGPDGEHRSRRRSRRPAGRAGGPSTSGSPRARTRCTARAPKAGRKRGRPAPSAPPGRAPCS